VTGASDPKAAARKAAFARRKEAHGRGLDGAAQTRLLELLAPHRGRVIAGFVPIRSEINPLPVMVDLAADGPVAVPVVEGAGQPLSFKQWRPGCRMAPGPFGAAVPVEGAVLVPEVLIVPLVAFDRRGGRLGYGGGYYDRTLQERRAKGRVLAVGYAYGAQEVDAVPVSPLDQNLDWIVTERGAIRAGG